MCDHTAVENIAWRDYIRDLLVSVFQRWSFSLPSRQSSFNGSALGMLARRSYPYEIMRDSDEMLPFRCLESLGFVGA